MKTNTRFKVEHDGKVIADTNTLTRAMMKYGAYVKVAFSKERVTLNRYHEINGSVYCKPFLPVDKPEYLVQPK